MRGGRRPRRARRRGARRGRRRAARRTASTATTPPTSPCSWPSRPAGRRARSPSVLAERAARPPGHRRASTSPAPASSTSPSTQGALGQLAVRRRRRPARRTGAPTRWPGSGSTWSSSRPTRPGRCTSAAPAGPRSATRSAGCSRPAAPTVDPGVLLQRRRRADRPVRPRRCWPPRTGEPAPEDGYAGDYIGDIAAQVVAAEPGRARPAGRRAAARSSGRAASS